jgi:hypothetical protein
MTDWKNLVLNGFGVIAIILVCFCLVELIRDEFSKRKPCPHCNPPRTKSGRFKKRKKS